MWWYLYINFNVHDACDRNHNTNKAWKIKIEVIMIIYNVLA